MSNTYNNTAKAGDVFYEGADGTLTPIGRLDSGIEPRHTLSVKPVRYMSAEGYFIACDRCNYVEKVRDLPSVPLILKREAGHREAVERVGAVNDELERARSAITGSEPNESAEAVSGRDPYDEGDKSDRLIVFVRGVTPVLHRVVHRVVRWDGKSGVWRVLSIGSDRSMYVGSLSAAVKAHEGRWGKLCLTFVPDAEG